MCGNMRLVFKLVNQLGYLKQLIAMLLQCLQKRWMWEVRLNFKNLLLSLCNQSTYPLSIRLTSSSSLSRFWRDIRAVPQSNAETAAFMELAWDRVQRRDLLWWRLIIFHCFKTWALDVNSSRSHKLTIQQFAIPSIYFHSFVFFNEARPLVIWSSSVQIINHCFMTPRNILHVQRNT
jgi:hypothetical protein